ncbi:MAG TPA: NAD(P)/FAD-dependent oxidoreductase [Pyrinomonadaceae bacterium]|nr:NAD(P)/FAD-dependent oxidoreductase [Pyrinomonadaceae bacterium]
MTAEFDAIIVGGGPAGASAAIHLAASGARVLLAERERFPREKLCGEFISPECLEHFARLGVSEAMSRVGGARVSETVFYAPSGRGVSVPSAWFGGQGGDALGLSRAEMDARLLARAKEVGVEVFEEAAIASLVVEGGRVSGVRLQADGRVREFRARVTLDATGRHRAVVRRAGRELGREADDRREGRVPLVAFKAHLEGARGAEGVCEIYFYPGGYGGLSPVEKGLSNLCFIARARDVRERESDAGRVMREVLMRNRRAARTLEGAAARTRWVGVSLEGFGRHEPAPFEGLLAVGDAAAFIDPFTGSGMLMALEGGELAARAVSRWLARGGEVFDEIARDYRRAYAARFDARLRLCGLLRRAALAPTALAEVSVVALNASTGLRRRLARSTRGREGAG